jgi:hypothetical protein
MKPLGLVAVAAAMLLAGCGSTTIIREPAAPSTSSTSSSTSTASLIPTDPHHLCVASEASPACAALRKTQCAGRINPAEPPKVQEDEARLKVEACELIGMPIE